MSLDSISRISGGTGGGGTTIASNTAWHAGNDGTEMPYSPLTGGTGQQYVVSVI